jgi:hypothetical protein
MHRGEDEGETTETLVHVQPPSRPQPGAGLA